MKAAPAPKPNSAIQSAARAGSCHRPSSERHVVSAMPMAMARWSFMRLTAVPSSRPGIAIAS